MVVFGTELGEWFELDKEVARQPDAASTCMAQLTRMGFGMEFERHDRKAKVPW